MSRFHFLNVKNGDCSIIQHDSGYISMIDVCNARLEEHVKSASVLDNAHLRLEAEKLAKATGARKNYGQKAHPTNPIEYLRNHGIRSLFRLAITHPDMDHMDGLRDLLQYAMPTNYYDTANNRVIDEGWDGSPYRKEDWELYKSLRDSPPETNPKALRVYSGDAGIHRLKDWNGQPPGDGLHTLAPTAELVEAANQSGDFNDSSYVFMFESPSGRILMGGDSHDRTWEHIIENHADTVRNVDVLVAPHHGRKSGRSYDFLDVVNPTLTLFGNAPSKDPAYAAWRTRRLPFITNNMAGDVVVECDDRMSLYVTNEAFARDERTKTYYSANHRAWYVYDLRV